MFKKKQIKTNQNVSRHVNGRVVLKYSVVIWRAGREKPPLKTQHVIVRKPIALLQQRSTDVASIYPVLICMACVKNLCVVCKKNWT